jgi:alkaline phosphatase D
MGFFTAYRHAAADDLDLMFHLGDYIYEQAAAPGRPRAHLGAELTTLAQYRTRHALYKTDPDLQAAHAQYPWVVTWDDHDVDNNYAGATSERHDPVDQFLERRAAAYQAYYEHTPLRRQSIPRGPFAQVYRQFSWGSLASFFVLDTRQYRSDQPCGDGGRAAPCEETRNPALTMLGEAQERWLFSGLDRSVSRWNILPQQVMMAKVDVRLGPEPRFSMDQWSGYDAARTRLLEFLGRRQPSNPVVLTGDIHSNWVNDLKVDFEDARSPVVATELVGTSISSGGDGADAPGGTADMLARNPFVKFHNGQRGYVRCEVTADVLSADYRVIDVVTAPGGRVTTRASFRIRSGTPGAEPA